MISKGLPLGRVPTVVVEIMAGILLGEHVLGLIPEDSYLEFLMLLGFIFLMFLSGLEVDAETIIATFPKRGLTFGSFLTNPLLVGLGVYVVTLLLSFFAAHLMDGMVSIQNRWYFALIMSTSSVGVIVPILKDQGESAKRFGQMMLISAAIADILSIFLFTFTASYLEHGFRHELLLILLLIVFFLLVYFGGKVFVKLRPVQQVIYKLSHAASQIRVRGTMGLILGFVVVAQFVDAEVILGAFLAGVIMSIFMDKERSSLLVKLDGMGYGFFVPIFFIMVGANLDLEALQDFDNSFLFLGLLLSSLYLVKVIPTLVWVRLFGFRKALSGGVLLASRLSLIIAAAQIGLELEVITPAVNAAIIIVAVITCAVSPLLYQQLNPDERVRVFRMIIVGGGGVAVLLAERMKMHGYDVLILETDPERIAKLKEMGVDVVESDGRALSDYQGIGLQADTYVVVLTGDTDEDLEIASMIRRDLQHEKVISIPFTSEGKRKMQANDIEALDLEKTLANNIENMVLRPSTYTALIESFESFSVEEIVIKNPEVDGKQVKDLPFHKEGSLMLLRRKGEMHIPHGNTYLRSGDVITVIGNEQALEDFRAKLA